MATAQMLADLGTARRDLVSAPLADGKGRAIQDDPGRAQAVQAENKARQAKAKAMAANQASGERGAKFLAWNSKLSVL